MDLRSRRHPEAAGERDAAAVRKHKQIHVIFGEKKLEQEFEALADGGFHDKRLFSSISRAITDMMQNPSCGIKIEKRLWPKIYRKKYGITNLWKYNIPDGWRIIYTIKEDEIMILNVILEWFDHKTYEKRFKY